jgi:hypothetical protein
MSGVLNGFELFVLDIIASVTEDKIEEGDAGEPCGTLSLPVSDQSETFVVN